MADGIGNMVKQPLTLPSSIVASGSFTTPPIETFKHNLEGNISLQFKVTGTGTLKVEWLLSNDWDGVTGTFVIPSSETAPVTLFGSSSGDGTGNDFVNLPMDNNQAFKLKFSEDGTSNAITVTATLNMQ